MSSFVNRGAKVFDDGDGPALTQKRSEGRLKRYDSCQDLRAWCDKDEERRRYMLELMANPPSGGGGTGAGRYVPFATLIELLQTLKDGQIVGLQKKLDELEKELAAYRKLNLTAEQRAQLLGLTGSVKMAKLDLDKAGPSKDKDSVSKEKVAASKDKVAASKDNDSASKAKESTTVLFKRKDDGHSSGADSDSESQDLRKLLTDRDAQIKELKNLLAAKIGEIAEKDQVMKTAQDTVKSVSGKVDDNSQLQAQLEKTKDDLNSLRAQYDELKRKSSNCDDILAERDALRLRVKDYEMMNVEMERLRFRAKEADVLRMERDRLKERVDELATIETAYMKLLQETADYEQIAAERDMYKHKYEELADSNNDLEAMDDELKHLQGIEQERDYLLRELNEMRCTIADQEDEIQRLLIMVEKLSAGNNSKEERMVKGLSSMRIEMDKRNERIMQLETALADMPALEEEIRNLRDQLKNTIVTVAQDNDRLLTSESKLQTELDDTAKMLEDARQEVSKYMEQLATLQLENGSLRNQLEELRAASSGDTEFQDELVRERGFREQAEESLREALDKIEKLSAELAAEKDNALSSLAEKQSTSKELLEHSDSKYLREKEAKDLLQGVLEVTQDELDNEKLTRRALEERIKELEALLANTAKSSDSNRKLSLDMANEIEQLRAQLEAEKKKCEEMTEQGTTSISSNDLKNLKIQAEANEKIQALEKQVNELQAENEDLKNKLAAQAANAEVSDRIKELEKQVQDLQAENERLESLGVREGDDSVEINKALEDKVRAENANAELSYRINELEKQVHDLQAENERLMSLGGQEGDDSVEINKALEDKIRAENANSELRDRINEMGQQVHDLQAENERLKSLGVREGDDSVEINKALEDKIRAENANAELSDRINELEKQVQDLQAENERLKSLGGQEGDDSVEINKALEDKIRAEYANAELSDRINELEKQVHDLQAENERLKSLGGQEGDDSVEMNKALEDKIRAENANSELRDRINEMEQQVHDLQAENERLKSLGVREGDDSVEINKALEDKIRAENANSELRDRINELEKQVHDLQAENERLKSLGSREGDDSAEINKALEDKIRAENANSELRDRINELEKQVHDLQAENERLKSLGVREGDDSVEINKALEDKIRTENANAELRDRINELEKQVQVLQAENEQLKSLGGQEGTDMVEINKALEDKIRAQNANAELSDRINELEKLVQDLQTENERLKSLGGQEGNDLVEINKALEDKICELLAALEDLDKSTKKEINDLLAENEALRKAAQSDDCSDLMAVAATEKAEMEGIIKKLEAQLQTVTNQPADDDNLEDRATDCEKELEKFKQKITQLQAENQELQTQLDSNAPTDAGAELDGLREKISSLEGEIEQLKTENEKLKAAVGSTGKSQEECEQEMETMRKKLAQLEIEKQNLLTKIDSAAPIDANAEIGSLRTLISNLETENEKLRSEIEKLNSGAAKDDKVLSDCEKELENLRKIIDQTEAEKQTLQSKLDSCAPTDARDEINALEAENKKRQMDCEKKLDALRKKIASLEATGTAVRKCWTKNELLSELDSLKSKALTAEAEKGAELDSLRKKFKGLEDENDKLKSELDSLKKKLEKLEQDNKDLQRAADNKATADSRKEIEDLRKMVASLEAEKERLNRDKKDLVDQTAELDSLKKKLGKLEQDNNDLQRAADNKAPADSRKEIEDLRKKVASLEDEIERLNRDKKDLVDQVAELDSLKKKLGKLEQDNSDLQRAAENIAPADSRKEIEDLRKKVASLEDEIERLNRDKKDLVDQAAELDSLKKKLGKLEQDNKDLQRAAENKAPADSTKEIEDLRKKVASLEDEIERLNRDKKDLVDQVAELDSLKKKLGKLEQDNNDLQRAAENKATADSRKEIDDLRKKVASLEDEIERLNRDKKDLVDQAAELSKNFKDRLSSMTKTSLLKIQQSVEKLKGALSPEDHAKIMKETEDMYEQRLATLKEEYERRYANLIEQNTKNLTSLKEMYERDMKTLNDRHNESVLRLQNLHEQEIREINDNYGKEITNIESSHDGSILEVRKQSRDSIKNIKAMHDIELEKLRKQYEDMISKLVADHNEEKERLTNKLKMDIKDRDNKLQELEESRQEEKGGKEIVGEKQDELIKDNSAEETKLKYEAMLNRLTDSNDKKMQQLKDRYEQLLEEERRKNVKYIQQLELTKTDVHEVMPEPDRLPVSVIDGEGSSSDKLIAILNKILATGIESLTFEELSFLHECICAASGKKILSNPDFKLSTMSPELHGMDKKDLCSRVQILEKELMRRDKETQRKVCCLEKCVGNEKRRLEELRQTLKREQRKCMELGSQHDLMKMETANCADKARKELEKERGKCYVYELQMKQLRAANRHLQSLLDAANQRQSSHPLGTKDADPVGAIRMRLDESLETEPKLSAKTPNPAALHLRNQVPTRQPAPSRRPDQRSGVTNKEPLVQGPHPRSAYPAAELGPGQHTCPALCNVRAPTPRAGQQQCKAGETTGSRKTCPQTSGLAKAYTELQVLTQRDTFVSACGARLASKKTKKSNK